MLKMVWTNSPTSWWVAGASTASHAPPRASRCVALPGEAFCHRFREPCRARQEQDGAGLRQPAGANESCQTIGAASALCLFCLVGRPQHCSSLLRDEPFAFSVEIDVKIIVPSKLQWASLCSEKYCFQPKRTRQKHPTSRFTWGSETLYTHVRGWRDLRLHAHARAHAHKRHTHTRSRTHTYIYIYIYICTHTHARTHSHAHPPTNTHTHTHTHNHTHTHTHTHVHTHTMPTQLTHPATHTHTHTHTHTRPPTYLPTPTHTRTHAYTRTRTHTHACVHVHAVCACGGARALVSNLRFPWLFVPEEHPHPPQKCVGFSCGSKPSLCAFRPQRKPIGSILTFPHLTCYRHSSPPLNTKSRFLKPNKPIPNLLQFHPAQDRLVPLILLKIVCCPPPNLPPVLALWDDKLLQRSSHLFHPEESRAQ